MLSDSLQKLQIASINKYPNDEILKFVKVAGSCVRTK